MENSPPPRPVPRAGRNPAPHNARFVQMDLKLGCEPSGTFRLLGKVDGLRPGAGKVKFRFLLPLAVERPTNLPRRNRETAPCAKLQRRPSRSSWRSRYISRSLGASTEFGD